MKLKDLPKKFDGCDPEAEIFFRMADGCCGDCFDLDDPYVDHWPDNRDPSKVYCLVEFPALDFLVSCRSSSAAQSVGRSVLKKP